MPGVGRLRVFDALKKVADTIPDDRREPTPFVDAPPIQPLVPDILPAQDTWVNALWLGFDYAGIDRLNIINKFKYEFYRQNQDDPRDIDGRRLRTNTSFFGLINKFDYNLRSWAASASSPSSRANTYDARRFWCKRMSARSGPVASCCWADCRC